MFFNATHFNHDIQRWNIARVQRMVCTCLFVSLLLHTISFLKDTLLQDSMFHDATAFQQNLCNWQLQLNQQLTCYSMFKGTSCSEKPNNCRNAGGSFCESCNQRKY
mmetsp:Transcript_10760/g.24953  ORF Transcript_10760/g.24953 Transcript_10760/m.24953 type:complete len:106 (+) Transcript_10760:764-1081(+)